MPSARTGSTAVVLRIAVEQVPASRHRLHQQGIEARQLHRAWHSGP